MDTRFNMDIYQYGSMRDFKHRDTLKHADWGNGTPLLEKVVSGVVFVCFWAIVLTLLLIVF